MSPQLETKNQTEPVKGSKFKSAQLNRVLNEKHDILGVEFAPINIPWERRLQTLSVLTWLGLFFVSGPLSVPILIYIFFYTRLWILVPLYFAWIYIDRETCEKGGRRSEWVRNWRMWYHYKNYFPITLVKTCELDPKRNYLFCSHPHGILSSGTFVSFMTEGNEVGSKVFPGLQIHGITLKLNFMIPFFREWCLALGLCSAKKESMSYLLSHPNGGKGVVLVPGGAPEALETHPGSYRIQLKKKKGFIKLALQNGCPLVPVFSFGENEIYNTLPNQEGSVVRTVQDFLTRLLTFAPVLFFGRGIFQYSFGFMPQRKPIHVAVGAPIHVEKIEKPSQEDIDNLHAKYVKALEELFNAHRDEYAEPSHEFKIV